MTNRASRHIAPAKKNINYQHDHTTFIILAAAVGKRMKTYGPKALLKYDESTTILDQAIQTIYFIYPTADIVLVVGFDYHKFVSYKQKYPSIRLVNNHLHDTTHTLYSTRLGVEASVGNRIIIMHGDILFSSNAIYGLTNNGSKIVVCDTMSKDDIGICGQDNVVTNISYGLEHKWGQIVYVT